MSNITLPLPEVSLPSGRYAVSFKSCPLVPGEPGAKMSIPLSVPAPPPQIWKLHQLFSLGDHHIYILGNEDDTFYLGTTTSLNTVIPEGPGIVLPPGFVLPIYATTTRNKEDAWKFRLEPVSTAQVNEFLAGFPVPVKDRYILVQVQDTGNKEVLTVQPPIEDLVGTLGTVRVEQPRLGESKLEYIWGLELALDDPTVPT